MTKKPDSPKAGYPALLQFVGLASALLVTLSPWLFVRAVPTISAAAVLESFFVRLTVAITVAVAGLVLCLEPLRLSHACRFRCRDPFSRHAIASHPLVLEWRVHVSPRTLN